MEYEVYCDESSLEALSNKDAHDFITIGGIWIPANKRQELKEGLNEIKKYYNIRGEFKWQKVSPAYIDFYKEIVNFYYDSEFIRFRAIVIESSKVDNIKFNNNDNELSFYKFYYQLINKWIYDQNSYNIFLDYKSNRIKKRLHVLKNVLVCSNLSSTINNVQALPSHQSLGIQLADLLTGIVSAKFNREITSKAKNLLIKYLEDNYLRREIRETPRAEFKFNIFRINLQGEW